MTMFEYGEMMLAIEECEYMERKYCKQYCELNPQDRERREHDRDLVLGGLMRARYALERRMKGMVKE